MYTRNYYPEEQMSKVLPDNYDGTAFSESISPEAVTKEETVDAGAIPILGSLFGKGAFTLPAGLKMPKIGTEELMIIAVAAFLFFSKSGDRECALILLFLLFVN